MNETEQLMQYFMRRATVRQYTEQPIDPALMERMIAAAAHAPNTGGMQLYSVVVTTDPEIKAALSPCHFNQPMVTQAPAVLTFCADYNRFEAWCRASNAQPGFNNFESFMAAVIDATVFAQQFNTIAEVNGLGCCYLGTTTYNAGDIARVLHLPKRVVPVVTLTVGYPHHPVTDDERTERLPLEAIVHHNLYTDYDDRAIATAYAEKEALPRNRQFVAENGKESLAQVFTDVRYPRDAAETFSRLFRDFVVEQGFPFP